MKWNEMKWKSTLEVDFTESRFEISSSYQKWKCTNPIIFGIWNGIIPSWAAKRRMKELKIPYESRKVHFAAHGGIFIYHNC